MFAVGGYTDDQERVVLFVERKHVFLHTIRDLDLRAFGIKQGICCSIAMGARGVVVLVCCDRFNSMPTCPFVVLAL